MRFLLCIAHVLTFNMYKYLSLDGRIFKIMPFFPKLLSCPVCVHLAQFSYIHKTRFFHEHARHKRTCQPLCCMLIVFSLRFVNINRLRDQCLVYKANGQSGCGCSIDPAVLMFFFVPHFWADFFTLNPSSRTSFTALEKVVDHYYSAYYSFQEKACKRFDVLLPFPLALLT